MPEIKVSDKALAHLSRGLYRSPASALKELVSNAWDANARVVRIRTNYPNFMQLSCFDDGDGFTKRAFSTLMSGGIGNSTKRNVDAPLINGRPIIGRLGIGMMAIAQICGAFTITSRPKTGEPFRARIKLYDLLKESLDQDAADVVKKAATPSDSDDGPVREVDIGEYDFLRDDLSEVPYGTSIVSSDIHPAFTRAFQASLVAPKFVEPNTKWEKNVGRFYRVTSLRELGDYWRLL